MIGIEERDHNGLHIVRLHYTADPAKRSAEWLAGASEGLSKRQVRRELEIDWSIASGLPVYAEDFQRDWHVAKQELQAVPHVPVLRGWDFGLCYSADTEVLTKTGWKFFRDVIESDEMATRNPMTGELAYAYPEKLVCMPYRGKLIGWQSQNIDCLVTPEHLMPFTYRDTPSVVCWQSAQWLAEHDGGHHYLDLVAKWQGCESDLPFNMDSMTYATLMGYYLSEGSVSIGYGAGGRTTIYQNEQRQDWQQVLNATGFIWKWKTNSKGGGWHCNNSELAKYLKQFGIANSKCVPQTIKEMDGSHIRAFLGAYTEGDGHIRTRQNGSVEWTIFTISSHMADDLQELALKAGWYARIRKVKSQESIIQENGRGRVIRNNGGYSITLKRKATRGELLRRNYREVDYDGKVYCVRVPWHTLYVRRNGRSHWNGNTPACVVAQLTATGRLNVLYPEFVTWTGRGEVRQQSITALAPVVVQQCALFFGQRQWRDWADPAGWQKAQTDEKTCVQVMTAHNIHPVPGEVTFTGRRRGVESLLRRAVQGQAMLQIDPRCTMLIEGFEGAYKFEEIGQSGRYREDVDKNAWSHPMNAFEYLAGGIYGRQAETRDEDEERERRKRKKALEGGY